MGAHDNKPMVPKWSPERAVLNGSIVDGVEGVHCPGIGAVGTPFWGVLGLDGCVRRGIPGKRGAPRTVSQTELI